MTNITANQYNILVLVGSTNPVKGHAAKEGILHLHSGANVELKLINADHEITEWKSPKAKGQPFGLEQTRYGAVNRMENCWKQVKEQFNNDKQWAYIYAIGFENGLVQEKNSKTWNDTCFVAVREILSNSKPIVLQGAAIPTEFGLQADKNLTFDELVQRYHDIILPKIKNKQDLYLDWTKNISGGPYTREHFLKTCLVNAVSQLLHIQKGKDLVDGCAKEGIVASLGPRYRNMHWMRDLAYMAPAYIARSHAALVKAALEELCKHQIQDHKIYTNGYETLNRYGCMPIVCVAKERERDFLMQRIQGTNEDPYWQIQLWKYCKNKKPGLLNIFPAPFNKVCDSNIINAPSLSDCKVQDLRNYYSTLLDFKNRIAKSTVDEKGKPPGPSFALRSFIDGTLTDLTPGTRDSEIHFIRTLLSLLEWSNKEDKQDLLESFAKPLAGALFHLYISVIDSDDGLPQGCDSRDIFADLLYDSKTLTNAVFWYEAMNGLLSQATRFEKTPLREYINEAVSIHCKLNNKSSSDIPSTLLELAKFEQDESKPLVEIFSKEADKIKSSIKNRLLTEKEQFKPKDFIPGKRAELGLTSALTPSPAVPIILNHNPKFVSGENVDPQSLAHAVLNGLISKERYSKVLEYFRDQDSEIGVTVFVPISGKTEEESKLLQDVKGRVMWPHVTWTVVSALIHMGTPESILMAKEQVNKLISLKGFGEWYAVEPKNKNIVQGGDPQQGWAASSMLIAMAALDQLEKENNQ